MMSARQWVFLCSVFFALGLRSGAGEEETNVAAVSKPPRKLSSDFFAREIARIESDVSMSEWEDAKHTWSLTAAAKKPKLLAVPFLTVEQHTAASQQQAALKKAKNDVEKARQRYAQLHSKWVSRRSELAHLIHDHVAAIEARFHQNELIMEHDQMITQLRTNITVATTYLSTLKLQINRAKRESGHPTSSLPAHDVPQGVPVPATNRPLSELMRMRRAKEAEVRKLKRRLLYWTNQLRAASQAVPELEDRVQSYAKRRKSLSDSLAQLGHTLKKAGQRLQHALRAYLSFLTNDVEALSQHPGARSSTTMTLVHKLHDSERKEKEIARGIEKLERKLKLAKKSTKKYKNQMKQRKVWMKPLQITLKTVKQAEAELSQVAKTLREISQPMKGSASLLASQAPRERLLATQGTPTGLDLHPPSLLRTSPTGRMDPSR